MNPPDGPTGTRQLPRHPVLSDDVYEAVKALIIDNELGPNTKLSIDGLSRELAVSPTPMREALSRLEADGLVVKQPLRGYSTTPLLSHAELTALYEFRLRLEPWAAHRAAELATRDDRARLRAEVSAVDVAGSQNVTDALRAMTAHDARLHDDIARLSGNAVLREALARTHVHLHVFRLHFERGIGSQALSEHREIVREIAAGRPDDAEEAMRRHLERALARLEPMT